MAKTSTTRDKEGLMPREALFVEYYLIHLNATTAAILAGYKPSRAGATGNELLNKPHVALALAKRKDARIKRLQAQQDDVLKELLLVCKSDLNHYVRKGSTVVAKAGIDPNVTRALSKIKIKTRTYREEDGTEVTMHETEIGVHPKVPALDLAMKHLGMFPQKALEIEETEDNTLVIREVIE